MFKRLLFVHDHRFVVRGSEVYSEGKLGRRVLSRYSAISNSVLVVARSRSADEVSIGSYEASSVDRVDFQFIVGRGWGSSFSRYLCHNINLIWGGIAHSDAVILRVPSILSILAIPFILILRRPYFVEVVGDPKSALLHAVGGGVHGRIVSSIFSAITAYIVRHALAAIYVTRSFLQTKYPCCGYMSSASNVEILAPPDNVLALRLEKSGRSNFKSTLTLGIIASYSNNYKGIDILIRSLAELKTYFPSVKLKIVGAGDKTPLVALAKSLSLDENIEFVGSLSRKKIIGFLDSIDLYCQPSRSEGLPRALVEAMSRGCPAVGTRVGGMPELLEDDALVEPENDRALAEALINFSSSIELRNSASTRNFNVAKDFDARKLEAIRSDFWHLVAVQYSALSRK